MLQALRNWKTGYKNSKFSSRLISWLLILSVVSALTYNFEWNYIVTLISSASILVAVEILVFRPYFLSAGVITLLFWFSFVVYMSFLIEGLVYYQTANQLTYIEMSMYGGAVISTILILSANWYIANGRYWVNLTVSYALYLVALIFLPVFSLNPIYVPLVAFTPVLIWVLVRRLWLYRKDREADISSLPQTKNDTVFESKMRKKFPKSHIMTEDRTVIIYNKKNVILLLPVTPETSIDLTRQGIDMDGEDITFVMNHLTSKLSIISKAAKVNGRKFFPVIYITNSKMERGITPVSYKSRRKPDITEGTVFFANEKDFPRFMGELTVNAPHFTPKEQARYEKTFTSSVPAESNAD